MEFALSDEQRALQDAVRSYLRDRFGPTQVRAVYEDPSGDGDPAELWKAMGEQGWLAVLVPEEHDGMGLGLLDASVIAREFGAMTTPGPWLGTVLAAEAVRLAGSPDQQKSWLSRLASGETRGAVALQPPRPPPIPAHAPPPPAPRRSRPTHRPRLRTASSRGSSTSSSTPGSPTSSSWLRPTGSTSSTP